jgi:2-keto-4-pentenoate hydratase
MKPAVTTKAAELLALSRGNSVRPLRFPPTLSPQSLEEGYAIQIAAARLRNSPLAGYKIGLTSAESQHSMGAEEPIAGRLAVVDLHRSPARVHLGSQHLRIVEAEVVFEIGRALLPGQAPFTEIAVADAVRSVFAGIEICDSRFSSRDDLPLEHLVADNSNADLLVVGEPLADWREPEFANLPIKLTRQDRPVVTGSPGRVLGHPLSALTWLANWLAARGEGLIGGQLIASGTCTGMVETAFADVVVATFGSHAKVAVELVAQNVSEVEL